MNYLRYSSRREEARVDSEARITATLSRSRTTVILFLACLAFYCGQNSFGADKSGVSPTTISLPKGPGSIEGLGESFQPSLNTGTAKYGVNLAVPSGPAGNTPAVALRYEGGGGNGPVGFGWSLPWACVQRRTDEGIPTYGETFGFARTDVFINEMKEELVPQANGDFFCENEGAFIRYRRTNSWWVATGPDGTRMEFGVTPSARVAQGTNVFCWLLERQSDTRGNTILYSYTNFSGAVNTNQKYLSGIRYGPGAPTPTWANYHFVTFEYENRLDWFEDCRAGFPVRTGKRLKRVVVGTHGPVLPGHLQGDFDADGAPDNLVRRYDLEYVAYAGASTHWSLLGAVRPVGANGTTTLPASTFGYRVCNPPATTNATGFIIGSTNTPPFLMDDTLVELADLNGDGLPDILKTELGAPPHVAYLNLGEGKNGSARVIRWRAGQTMGGDIDAQFFNLRSDGAGGSSIAHLADMDGDGVSDFAVKSGTGETFYFANLATTAWGVRKNMSTQDFPPPSPFGATDVRTADLDFDKRIDIVKSLSLNGGYQVWFNLGNQNYSSSYLVMGDSGFNMHFAQAGVQIADMNGDRVPDIAMVMNDRVLVTAGRGYGRFRAEETMLLDSTILVPLSQAKLTDITGDGLADLVVERADGSSTLWYWINMGTNGFSGRKQVTGLPVPTGSSAIRWADINGNGSTDYIFAESITPSLQSVDLGELLNCGVTPNMLAAITNGIGRVTLIGYESSMEFQLDDAAAGQPWTNGMPFPVQVVAAVTNLDSLGHSYVTQFRYHDGYYDPEEKQFRGFARVEQIDVGDSTAPTLVTRSHFDTGRAFEVMKGKLLRLTAEQTNGLVFSDEQTTWVNPPRTLMTGINGQAVRFVHPVASVKTVKELGQGVERRLESEVAYDRFGNQTTNTDYGIVEGGNRGAFDDERITTIEYAINTNVWILRTPKRSEIKDENGVIISRTECFYDDETFSGNNLGLVSTGNVTMKRDFISPAISSAFVTSMRAKYDAFGNITNALDPLAVAPGGSINLANGHLRTLDYDSRFHTYPVKETIYVGDGSAPLVFQVAYDEGFGTVTSSTDFNNNSTAFNYDVFGRLINIVRPGDTPAFPTVEYDYALAVPYRGSNIINYVETRQLDKPAGTLGLKRNHYFLSRQFVDGLGRKLQSRIEAEPATPGGPSRVVVKEALTFNQRLKPARILNPFFAIPGGSLDTMLDYESIEVPGWMGQFQFNGALVALNLVTAHQIAIRYDATLRETQTINPDGTIRTNRYEPLLTRSFDENDADPASPHSNTPMVHVNDGLGRLVQVDEVTKLNDDGTPAGGLHTWTTRYQYDLNDQLTRITDSQNNVKTFAYDGLKRKTFMNDPDRGVMNLLYDDASNLLESTDAKGQRITYTYDGVNRIRSEDYHDEGQPFSRNFAFNPALPISATNRPDVAYFYDVPQASLDLGDGSTATAANIKGKLAYVWDLSGEEHTSFDARDRVAYSVKRVRDPLHSQLVSYRTGFAYDSLDRLTTLTYPDNDAVSYTYNDRNLLAQITGGPTGSILSNLVYWPSDQQQEVLYGNNVRTSYVYDNRLRLKELSTVKPQTLTELVHFAYDFDGVSNIRSIEDRRPGSVVPAGHPRRNTQTFDYDSLYRLTRVQYSFALGPIPTNNGEITYRYDRIGNMLAQFSSLNHVEKGLPVANLGTMDSGGTAGRMGRIGRAASDPPGPHALTRISNPQSPVRNYPYDANGNMLVIDGLTNTWDFKDRLVRVEDTNMVADYTYDHTDRRITKRVQSKKAP